MSLSWGLCAPRVSPSLLIDYPERRGENGPLHLTQPIAVPNRGSRPESDWRNQNLPTYFLETPFVLLSELVPAHPPASPGADSQLPPARAGLAQSARPWPGAPIGGGDWLSAPGGGWRESWHKLVDERYGDIVRRVQSRRRWIIASRSDSQKLPEIGALGQGRSGTSARSLGVTLDDQLCFSGHIATITWTSQFSLHNIRRIRPFLTQEATQLLVQALVISHLDYCNSLLAGLPACAIKPLQLTLITPYTPARPLRSTSSGKLTAPSLRAPGSRSWQSRLFSVLTPPVVERPSAVDAIPAPDKLPLPLGRTAKCHPRLGLMTRASLAETGTPLLLLGDLVPTFPSPNPWGGQPSDAPDSAPGQSRTDASLFRSELITTGSPGIPAGGTPLPNKPVYSTPSPVENTPQNNECKMVELRGAKVASFTVDGCELICLPQAFDLFLKHLVGGLHTVYTKLKRLEITPVVCNVEQVRILRGLGAIQPGVNRCKLISRKDFETLYNDCTNARFPWLWEEPGQQPSPLLLNSSKHHTPSPSAPIKGRMPQTGDAGRGTTGTHEAPPPGSKTRHSQRTREMMQKVCKTKGRVMLKDEDKATWGLQLAPWDKATWGLQLAPRDKAIWGLQLAPPWDKATWGPQLAPWDKATCGPQLAPWDKATWGPQLAPRDREARLKGTFRFLCAFCQGETDWCRHLHDRGRNFLLGRLGRRGCLRCSFFHRRFCGCGTSSTVAGTGSAVTVGGASSTEGACSSVTVAATASTATSYEAATASTTDSAATSAVIALVSTGWGVAMGPMEKDNWSNHLHETHKVGPVALQCLSLGSLIFVHEVQDAINLLLIQPRLLRRLFPPAHGHCTGPDLRIGRQGLGLGPKRCMGPGIMNSLPYFLETPLTLLGEFVVAHPHPSPLPLGRTANRRPQSGLRARAGLAQLGF
ncbi:hypothetical protein AAFF_G00334970 [Aldrovandia affinis]|uniref:SKI/SNO/DAC domain-containing protein n=1 Tax=Aldrovandia affinis TaxID=143900 RepID=A0AAD7SL45_9TELE|nr:hypothetical protein AAFF_G00334970 [Aldrovandia affinis]